MSAAGRATAKTLGAAARASALAGALAILEAERCRINQLSADVRIEIALIAQIAKERG